MRITQSLAMAILLMTTSFAFSEVGKNDNVLNPNLANKSEMSALPGLNETLATEIIAQRPLTTNQQLDELLGDALNPEAKTTLRAQLFLPINLNSASEAELQLVPGINRKMVHEFDEYRPYSDLKQFRREIGKYVDEKEVARYEQYVFVPVDLNSASAEDLATIPGINRKMIHEFEEYRPYSSMEQFRREIGKYVDEKEVARYERYVEIK